MARVESQESVPEYPLIETDAEVLLRQVSDVEDEILPAFFSSGPTLYALDPDNKRIRGRGFQPRLFSKGKLTHPSKPFRLDESE